MSIKIKRFCSVLVVITLVFGGVVFYTNVTERKDSKYKYAPFIEEDTNYDVMFFGTSHVINGIYPMQIWKNYGITSYNFGGHAHTIPTSYWVYKNAIQYHKPKVAVFDVYCEPEMNYKSTSEYYVHVDFDAFPKNKIVRDAVSDIWGWKDESKRPYEILFPFSVYHSRWNEITGLDYLNAFKSEETTTEKGAEQRVAVERQKLESLIPKEVSSNENTIAKEYVIRFINDCRNEGIQPVLINIPYGANDSFQAEANTYFKIAEEYDIPYINMMYTIYGDLINPEVDFYDGSHLNPMGARKVSNYLGAFLAEEYNLENKLENTKYSNWADDYAMSLNHYKNIMSDSDSLEKILVMMYDSDYEGEIRLSSISLLNEVQKLLIEQVGDRIEVKEEDVQGISIEIFDDNQSVMKKQF